ncbi:chitinase 2-like [Solanum lycopersicum]|uniref:chitinase 2-like n=1 Tax=Solanum lycopersicum TaxID=4081 RepID=UPI00374A8BDC
MHTTNALLKEKYFNRHLLWLNTNKKYKGSFQLQQIMKSLKFCISLLVLQALFNVFPTIEAVPAFCPGVFREYIGAEGKNVTFSDVPINPNIEFHFLLSFAIDYTNTKSPEPTNGDFLVYWDTDNLTPSHISSIKAKHKNVKVGMSLGGDTVNGKNATFTPTSITSWVSNAIHSITKIVKEYNLDAIDIDYEHFNADPDTFAECIGRLLYYLKQNNVVTYTSIAPYADDSVQVHYSALWRKYGHLIDYVNFQFYAYEKGTTILQFLHYFETQMYNYKGGKILVSFGTDNSGGLSPRHGFFDACNILKSRGTLHGIFIWSADDSIKDHFLYEKLSQNLLASATV